MVHRSKKNAMDPQRLIAQVLPVLNRPPPAPAPTPSQRRMHIQYFHPPLSPAESCPRPEAHAQVQRYCHHPHCREDFHPLLRRLHPRPGRLAPGPRRGRPQQRGRGFAEQLQPTPALLLLRCRHGNWGGGGGRTRNGKTRCRKRTLLTYMKHKLSAEALSSTLVLVPTASYMQADCPWYKKRLYTTVVHSCRYVFRTLVSSCGKKLPTQGSRIQQRLARGHIVYTGAASARAPTFPDGRGDTIMMPHL